MTIKQLSEEYLSDLSYKNEFRTFYHYCLYTCGGDFSLFTDLSDWTIETINAVG